MIIVKKKYNIKKKLPNAARLLMKVIVKLRLRFPFSRTVHMLLAPPPGLQPNVKSPNCRIKSSNSNRASP